MSDKQVTPIPEQVRAIARREADRMLEELQKSGLTQVPVEQATDLMVEAMVVGARFTLGALAGVVTAFAGRESQSVGGQG